MELLAGRNLCAAGQPVRNGQLSMPKVAADDMCDHVRHFLGYHMIKEFEVLDFLEESGISTLLFQQTQHDFSFQQNAESLNTWSHRLIWPAYTYSVLMPRKARNAGNLHSIPCVE